MDTATCTTPHSDYSVEFRSSLYGFVEDAEKENMVWAVSSSLLLKQKLHSDISRAWDSEP